MLRKLYEILGIAKEYSIDAILCGGDFFHLKSWMRNPYELTNRLIDAFNSMPCKTWGIFGDHDVPGRNEGSLERQPLMTLCKLTNLGLLSKGEFWGHSTVLSGAPKTDNYESDLTNYIPVFGGSQDENTIRIHMSHGDL
jgi:DNA repair exonuclease SbcCD nuclease subunit